MKIRKNGVDFLLAAELLLLVAVLALGLFSGVSGLLRDEDTSGSSVNTDKENDSSSTDEDETQNETSGYVIPEDYVEGRQTFSEAVEQKLAAMTVEQKVAQLFMVSPEALTGYDKVTVFGNASKNAFNTYPVGGLVYSVLNFENAEQTKLLISNTKQYSLEQYGFTVLTAANTDDGMKFLPLEMALGYDVSDIFAVDGTNMDVVALALKDFPCASVTETNANGILYCGVSLEELSTGDLLACQTELDAGAPIVMMGNIIVPGITDDENVPCSLSGRAVALLRQEMGFDGVIISSDFSEAAFANLYGNGTACVEAIKAGVDMIFMPADFAEAYQAVLDAVNGGNISEDRLNNAVGRILTVKGL